jgi:hypothetical protein
MGLHRGVEAEYALRELHRHRSLLRQQAPHISETIAWIVPCILFHVLLRDCHGFD